MSSLTSPMRTMCIKQRWPVRGCTAAGFWEGNPAHPGIGAMLTAPPWAFLHPCRSGSRFRFFFPLGLLALHVLAVLIWVLLLASWIHLFAYNPGGAARALKSLLYWSISLLHHTADMAHGFMCNPLDRELPFVLLVVLQCQGCHERVPKYQCLQATGPDALPYWASWAGR